MSGYYQLIEGCDGGFMFTLRAGNHDTIFTSRIYWSRPAALEAVAAVRACSQDPGRYVRRQAADGSHYFELLDTADALLGRSAGCLTRPGLAASIASMQRNGPATVFRGFVRRPLTAARASGYQAG